MAKFQGILGGKITGKVGNLVFTQVAGVGTVAREYVAAPSNPQTPEQQAQRTKLANLVNFYRAFNGVLKGAFETKKASQSDYNAFVGKNLAANPIALTKTEASLGAVVVAPYIIAEGSLPQVAGSASTSASAVYVSSDLVVPESIDYTTVTVAELSLALLANNSRLSNGMQISLLAFINEMVGNPAVPRAAVQALEFTIDIADTSLFADVSNFASLAVAGSDMFGANLGPSVVAYAWILSQKLQGTLKVSSASITMVDAAYVNQYDTDAQRVLAAQSYGESAEAFLAPGGGGQAIPVIGGGDEPGGDDEPGTGGGGSGLE